MSCPRERVLGLATLTAALAGALLLNGCRPGGKAGLDDALRPLGTEPKFANLKGDPDEALVRGLFRAGVLDSDGSLFAFNGAVTRSDFVVWLVRANDIYFRDQPAKQIHLASPKELPIFSDVPANDRVFPYLQGMVNAGYVVGFDKTEFGTDRALTRQCLVLLRDGLELGSARVLGDPADENTNRIQLRSLIKDADQVADKYVAAVLADLGSGDTVATVYGKVERLEPDRGVTRREAMRALGRLRGRTYEDALKLSPKWEPLPPAPEKKAPEPTEEPAKKG